MDTLHFDVSPASGRKLDEIFSSYGWSHSIAFDIHSVAFLLAILEKGIITVSEVPYDYVHDVPSKDPEIKRLYNEISRGTRWRPDTAIERARLNALYQLKEYGTPIVSDGKYFLYEKSHVAAYVGNEDVFSLITFLREHPRLQKWIIFPSPVFEGNAYYVFHLVPAAIRVLANYHDAVTDDALEKIQASDKHVYPDPSSLNFED